MPIKFNDLNGKRFGRLLVVEFAGRANSAKRRPLWKCKCDCGTEKVISADCLLAGHAMSCCCLRLEKMKLNFRTHGERSGGMQPKEYTCWVNIRTLCYNPKDKFYHCYGGRGIKVCERWRNSYENFLADMGRSPSGYSIERINNDGDYEPSNCCWADAITQRHNRRDSKRNKTSICQ